MDLGVLQSILWAVRQIAAEATATPARAMAACLALHDLADAAENLPQAAKLADSWARSFRPTEYQRLAEWVEQYGAPSGFPSCPDALADYFRRQAAANASRGRG